MNATIARRKTRTSPWKYVVGAVIILLIAYNSVYIKKLDEVKAAGTTGAGKFDAAPYAQTFWTTKLIPSLPNAATDLTALLSLLKTDKEKAFTTYSQALGIGNIRYFLVKGEGTVTAVNDNEITLSLTSGETVQLATEYIFGNAARDASGLIKITEFDNTTDLNNVSAAINDIIRKDVIPPLKAVAKPGKKLLFTGAIELNRAHLHLDDLTIIPILVE
jgi:predicted lipoprotein